MLENYRKGVTLRRDQGQSQTHLLKSLSHKRTTDFLKPNNLKQLYQIVLHMDRYVSADNLLRSNHQVNRTATHTPTRNQESVSPKEMKLKFLQSSLFGTDPIQYKHFAFKKAHQSEQLVNHHNFKLNNIPYNIDEEKLKRELRESGIHVQNLQVDYSPTPVPQRGQGRVTVRSMAPSGKNSVSPDILILRKKLEDLGMTIQDQGQQPYNRPKSNNFYQYPVKKTKASTKRLPFK